MLIGIILALIAAWCFAAGNALEKRALGTIQLFSRKTLRTSTRQILSSPWWIVGALVSVAGIAAQVVAFAHVTIIVVQSIGVSGLVLLVIIGQVHFREHFSRLEVFGVILATIGLVFVALSLHSAADTVGQHNNFSEVMVVVAVTLLGIGCLVMMTRWLDSEHRGFFFGSAAGICYGLSGLGAKGLSTLHLRPIGWGLIQRALETPYPYVFMGAWALGLVIFQIGLQRYRLGIVGPVSSMMASAYVVAVGTPLFGEHLPGQGLSLALRIGGFAGIVIASLLIAVGSNGDRDLAL